MLRFLAKILLFVLLLPFLAVSAESVGNNDASLELKEIIGTTISFRADGKIDIPSHIKHIKLDIGLSYNAPMSQHWLSQERDLIVFGFEPNPASVGAILRGENKHHFMHLDTKFIGKRFFLVPCALGLSAVSPIKFFVTKNDCGCSSLYVPKDFPIERVIEVPIFSLAAFFDLFPFDTHPVIDYIKIDAQGADLDIVKSAGDYLRKRVIYITLEPENSQYYDTVNSEKDINDYMHSIGFLPHVSDYVGDPTYVNSSYLDYIQKHDIRIYQKSW